MWFDIDIEERFKKKLKGTFMSWRDLFHREVWKISRDKFEALYVNLKFPEEATPIIIYSSYEKIDDFLDELFPHASLNYIKEVFLQVFFREEPVPGYGYIYDKIIMISGPCYMEVDKKFAEHIGLKGKFVWIDREKGIYSAELKGSLMKLNSLNNPECIVKRWFYGEIVYESK